MVPARFLRVVAKLSREGARKFGNIWGFFYLHDLLYEVKKDIFNLTHLLKIDEKCERQQKIIK